jgi:mono/diheme cytochrome c family protein
MFTAATARRVITIVLLAGLSVTFGQAGAQEPSNPGRLVYEKANCVGCHKWHGGGGGGYGGAALSLRQTTLERADLIEVIRCGRPATRMPYHDRNAYKGAECYGGMTKADLGADFPPKAAIFLRAEEIEAVADYVQTQLQGKGAPTHDDCVAFWGADSHECAAMK